MEECRHVTSHLLLLLIEHIASLVDLSLQPQELLERHHLLPRPLDQIVPVNDEDVLPAERGVPLVNVTGVQAGRDDVARVVDLYRGNF